MADEMKEPLPGRPQAPGGRPHRAEARKSLRRRSPLWIAFLRASLVLAVALGVAFALFKSRPRARQQRPRISPPLVEVVTARRSSVPMPIHAYGTVRSGESLLLSAEVRGKITEMAEGFEEGAYFSRSAFLMRIDPRDYELQAERLLAELKRLSAEKARLGQEETNLRKTLAIVNEDLALSQAEYDRNLALRKRKVVSQTQLDLSRQRWLQSRQKQQEVQNALTLIRPRFALLDAQRRAAEVQLKEARLAVSRTEITAPFDCRVAEKRVERGQFVAAGAPLARVYNVEIMEVEVQIAPRDLPWVPLPADPASALRGPPARIQYRAGKRVSTWEGHVSRVKAQLQESTRTLPVVIELHNGYPGGRQPLLPGMFVSVTIEGRTAENVFQLPQEAVREDGTVMVVEEGRLAVKPVRILRRLDNRVMVRGELEDGARVVTLIPGRVWPGMIVRTEEAKPAAGGAS